MIQLRQFVNEMFSEFTWDLVPFSFLYDLYIAWYHKNVGGHEVISKKTFVKNLCAILAQNEEWDASDTTRKVSPSGRMDRPEPLIADYELKDWMNPMFMSSTDVNKKCIPLLKVSYRGIMRKV